MPIEANAATSEPQSSVDQPELRLASEVSGIDWVSVRAGSEHTIGIRSDGTLWAWGLGNWGPFGLDDAGPQNTPVQVGVGTDWVSVSASYAHTLGIRSDGTLWAWGHNNYGQLGLGDQEHRYSPVQVGSDTDWASVSANSNHTLAIRSDGTLWAWGSNYFGEIGLSYDTTNRYWTPAQVGSDTDWVSVSCGGCYTLGLRSDGTLWAWGVNNYGQLGLGDTTNRYNPVQVGSDTDWVSISAGGEHAVGIRSEGTLWAWGSNSAGQLGLGDTTNRYDPVQVGSDADWASVIAGASHTLGIRSDGTLWAWGSNGAGQLGLGDTTHRYSAVQVGSDTDWVSVGTESGHTLGIRSDATLWAWGANNNGQLGLGDTMDRTSPVQVGTALVGSTIRVSTSSSGAQSDHISYVQYDSSISTDGRYVVFQSLASNLVPDDTNQNYDIFIKDTVTGTTRLISTSSSGTQGDDWSETPSISADGRYVAFASESTNLVPDDTNGTMDVFVKDTMTGATRLISSSTLGTQGGAGRSYNPSISADGRYVAFESLSPNLVADDTNDTNDVFVKDTVTGATRLISTSSAGAQGDSGASVASISASGRYVAFESWSTNLVADDTNDTNDVFVKDTVTGATRLISTSSSGARGDGWSSLPSISADGRYVAFESASTNLVPEGTNGTGDVFVKDTVTGATRLISTSPSGAQGDGWSSLPSISADGRYVAFESASTNLVGDDTNGTMDIFVKDTVTGATRRVSTTSSGAQGEDVFYQNGSRQPSISADGRYVAFLSWAENLVADDTNDVADVFVKDTVAEDVELHVDPVPVVEGNPYTGAPILVLIAGIDSDTGYHVAPPAFGAWGFGWEMNDPGHIGNPWEGKHGLGIGNPTSGLAQKLGAFDVRIMPTAPGSTQWPEDTRSAGYVIDSKGKLNYNINQLASWLRQQEDAGSFGNHPVILIGHSYGGVIARSMLARRALDTNGDAYRRIAGIIQFGSPNGGTGVASRGEKRGGWVLSDTVEQLTLESMATWNSSVLNHPVEKPVVRLGGTYAPDAVDFLSGIEAQWLYHLSSSHGNTPNDGWVAYDSLKDGFGLLDSSDFGGATSAGFWTLAHAGDLPGVGKTHTVGVWPGPITRVTYEEIVPQDSSGYLFDLLGAHIRNLGKRATAAASVPEADVRRSVAAAAEVPAVVYESGDLPVRTMSVVADEVTYTTIPLDASAMMVASSAEGTPTVAVRDALGAPIECASSTDVGADGVWQTFVGVGAVNPGEYSFGISLPPGVSGEIDLSGVVHDGARLALEADGSASVATTARVTARFESESAEPVLGATVQGVASLAGQDDVALSFRDDGAEGDVAAADGVYTAGFVAPVRGRWLLEVEALTSLVERTSRLVVDVGEPLATVTGPLEEVTTPGPGGTLMEFGIRVPLHVSEAGDHTLGAAVTDVAGARLGVVVARASLEADESTAVVALMDASMFRNMAEGPLTVSPLQITRLTDGIDLDAGSGPGLTTAGSYSPTDFYAFSVSLDGPAANPSPTNEVQFTGTALNTSSTVAAVEYSIDGSATWQPVAPLDGAFDSHAEDFSIDLSLPDYVYGLLVRQTGADGTQLPVADWAGKRFTIDTVAPAQTADLAALVTTETGEAIAHASWLPSDPPSDTVSPVRYLISLDGVEIGSTYDTAFDVAIPDEAVHVLQVVPIDGAGNTGPGSETEIAGVSIDTNEAPIAVADSYDVAEDTVLTVAEATGLLSNDTDADDDPLSAIKVTDPSYGSLTLDGNGSFTYTPAANYNGSDSFTYKANDGLLDSNTVTVTITVTAVNDAPVARADSYTTDEGVGITVPARGVLANDTDIDSEMLTASLSTDAGHGTLAFNASGGFLYTPDQGFSGTDSFTYRAYDGAAYSSAAIVTINVTPVDDPEPLPPVIAIAGDDRFETAVAASLEAYPDGLDPAGARTVVIATGRNWPDALGGSSLAGALDGPILLVDTHSVPAQVASEIARLGAQKAIILGGTAAVGTEVETALKTQLGDADVTRISGANRYETADKVAVKVIELAGSSYDGTAFVATGGKFPDALGAAPLAAANVWPLYLANPTTGLSAATKSAMDGVDSVLILGGTAVVSSDVETYLSTTYGDADVTRLAGSDRYETAVKVATWGVDNAGLGWNRVAIATGLNFPDALAGGVLQGKVGSVMLLTKPDSLNSYTQAALTAHKADITTVTFFGGLGALPQTVRDEVAAALE